MTSHPNNKTIVANWKMNPQTLTEAREIFKFTLEQVAQLGGGGLEVVVCPPFVFIEELAKLLGPEQKNIRLGAQDIFWETAGPFTGEISSGMLKNFGVSHILIGHSDRRYILGESDEMINKKIKSVLHAGLTPILLVGEKEENDYPEDVLVDQLSRDLSTLQPVEVEKVLLAYEPVWAISTTEHSRPNSVEETLNALEIIRAIVAKNWGIKSDDLPLLYGGSVNEKNVSDFLKQPEIQGLVVGGASLEVEKFGQILKVAAGFSV